jgi:hypothetical protein
MKTSSNHFGSLKKFNLAMGKQTRSIRCNSGEDHRRPNLQIASLEMAWVVSPKRGVVPAKVDRLCGRVAQAAQSCHVLVTNAYLFQ